MMVINGASADADRATHEQSPQAVSAVPVGIPSADGWTNPAPDASVPNMTTGVHQVVRASIPSADDIDPPTRADIYRRTKPAIMVLTEVLGCDHDRALDVLRGLVGGGYFIAPRIPTDAMLAAYFSAYGQQAWTPRTIIQNIGKARLRWQSMGQSGTAMALSRRFIASDAQAIEARRAETGTGSVADESAVRKDAPEIPQSPEAHP